MFSCEREILTCTQQVEPVCIASQRVTFVQGLIIALPSGVTTLLPAGSFRLDKLQREAEREREGERGTLPAPVERSIALSQWEGGHSRDRLAGGALEGAAARDLAEHQVLVEGEHRHGQQEGHHHHLRAGAHRPPNGAEKSL